MLGKDALDKAEKKVQSMRDVVGQTLDEDAKESANLAMDALNKSNDENSKQKATNSGVTGTKLVPEIMDPGMLHVTVYIMFYRALSNLTHLVSLFDVYRHYEVCSQRHGRRLGQCSQG